MENGWDELLPWLTVPRENGSHALAETADRLMDALAGMGFAPEAVAYLARPQALRLAGIVALLGCLFYARAMRERRFGLAAFVALAAPLLIVVDTEVRPLYSVIESEEQVNVVARVAPAEAVEQRLILSAHYDSKTDLFDHRERRWVEGASVPMVVWMLVAAGLGALAARPRRGEGVRRFVVASAPFAAGAYGLLTFATLTGGAFHPRPSPGALDDGAACALILKLGERLAAAPLARTEVELLFLSGEEVATQGARAYAPRVAAAEVPAAVVNLELIGAAPDLGYVAEEHFVFGSHDASPRLVALADETQRERRGFPLERFGGAVTDSREFLAAGIPAVTLASHRIGQGTPSGLHSAADGIERIDRAALDTQLDLLEDLARRIDRTGL